MNFQDIPQELKSLPQWVCFKKHKEKLKVPFNPTTGKPAATTSPSTWVDFQIASAIYNNGGYDGIGFVFSETDSYTGIDLDKCVEPHNNKVEPWASHIIEEFNSYTELSPSGTGAHIIIKGQLPPGINGRKKGGIEVYESQRYFTITGHRFTGIPSTIKNRQKELEVFYNKHFGGDSQTAAPSSVPEWWSSGPVDPTELPPDDKELVTGATSHNDKFKKLWGGDWGGGAYPSQSEADMALASLLAFLCNNDPQRIDRLFRASGLYREKWDRDSYGWNTIQKVCNSRQTSFKNGGEVKQLRDDFNNRIDTLNGESDFDELINIAFEISQSNLPETSQSKLLKMIAKKADVSIRSLNADIKKLCPERKESRHIEVAVSVIDSFERENILFATECFWLWKEEKGVWRQVDDREIKQQIHRVSDGNELTQSFVNSVFDLTKTETYRNDHKFDLSLKTINCQNGQLEWAGSRWELLPHNREDYRTAQIPIDYDSTAKALRFLQFLDEIFASGPDKEKKISLVIEIIGYCLLSSCEYEKFVFFIGPGANGKSVLMYVVEKLVGSDNVTAVQPSQFENKFQRAHLQSKLVNLVTEIAIGHQIHDAQLKAIVSGELTTAEHKHKPPFEFHPYATCIFGTNHLPYTRDFSDALFRRAIIIPFNRVFSEAEQDKKLKDKLLKELPGILNLALEGISNVFKRGFFTTIAEVEEAKNQWRLECDQAAQFAQDECEFGPGLSITSGALFFRYIQWAENAGIRKALSRKNFTDRMVRLGAIKHRGTGGTRILSGVDLKQDKNNFEMLGK